MKQILLFSILQMRKPRRERLGGQSPGSLAPEFVSLPHCHYNTIRINLGSQSVDVPGQMFTAFAVGTASSSQAARLLSLHLELTIFKHVRIQTYCFMSADFSFLDAFL